MPNELKQCPLCGEDASIDREYIFCNYCRLILRFDDFVYNGEAQNLAEARKMSIETWNRRVNNAE